MIDVRTKLRHVVMDIVMTLGVNGALKALKAGIFGAK